MNLMYGPPVRDAIAKNDLAQLKALAQEGRYYLARPDELKNELQKHVEELERAIQKLESPHR